MRIRCGWMLLAATLLWFPAQARAQYYEVPPTVFTGPLSHPQYNVGGPFTAIEFEFVRESRPLKDQPVAFRGFYDTTGNVTGNPPQTFIGSGDIALSTQELRGPGTFQPGFNLTMGYRFEDGVSVSASWLHLFESRYSATAALLPPDSNVGPLLENTFLSSPVVNFPLEFGGNPINIANSIQVGGTNGIWNAASLERIYFTQRLDIFEVTGRIPVWQTESFRTYGLIGPRIIGLWERFKWQTIDADTLGNSSGATTADYTNVVSNRLYGVYLGGGSDWYLGDTPIGAFSFFLDTEGGFYADFAKERPKYYRDDRAFGNARARNALTAAGSAEAKLGFRWNPWEAIEVQVGYQFIALFGTVSSPHPIDFNYGTVDPEYRTDTVRWIQGLTFGVGFVF